MIEAFLIVSLLVAAFSLGRWAGIVGNKALLDKAEENYRMSEENIAEAAKLQTEAIGFWEEAKKFREEALSAYNRAAEKRERAQKFREEALSAYNQKVEN